MSLSQAAILAPAFQLDPLIDGFLYGPGLAGASFMAAQAHTVLGL